MIVGASPDPARTSGRPLAYLKRYGYAGTLYVVNPKYHVVQGVTSYANVADLPGTPDLAVIVAAAELVPAMVRQCGTKGIPFAVVIASGFIEVGNRELNDDLLAAIRETGIHVTGPNCVGMLSTPTRTIATFSSVLQRGWVAEGTTSLVTQSGGLGNAVVQALNSLGIGLRTWVSSGNEIDLGVADYVAALLDDPGTAVIGAFVEGFRPGDNIVGLGQRAAALGKPIILLKAGRTQSGRASSLSHTGKLIGSGEIATAILRQSRIVQVDDLDELLDTLLLLDRVAKPVRQGTAIVTVSGALGVLLSDAAEQSGVRLASYATTTISRLGELLPGYTAVASNPLDVPLVGREDVFVRCCEIALEDPNVHALLIVLTSLAHNYDTIGTRLVELANRAHGVGKAIVISYLSPVDRLAADAYSLLAAAHVPVLESPVRALRALRHALDLGSWHAQRHATTRAPTEKESRGREAETSDQGERPSALLEAYGVATTPAIIAASPNDAVRAAQHFGYPVVVKIEAPSVLHKTEVGGIRLRLGSDDSVRAAFVEVTENLRRVEPEAVVTGVLVQPMLDDQLEVIVGISCDREFGPVLAIGRGGVATELDADVSFRALPATEIDVREMIAETKLAVLLAGHRGQPPRDSEALVTLVLRLVALYEHEPWILEIEANPVMVGRFGQGARVADVLIIPRSDEADAPSR